ncbi:MAG TPA: ABC transporter substrate-binding protein [Stellaceae bacterium]|nr:ABC transporter substrate-binding protein [Stellaceae bacterium]
MRIGFFIAAIVLNAAALFSLSLSPAHAAEKLTIGMIGSPDTGGWLYYIAIHEGYFAKEGIEPDFIYVPTAPGVMQQLVSGSLDVVGVDGVVEPIHARAKGADVAILRMTSNTTPYEMISKPSINSIKDLKGKTITIGGLMDINRLYLERIMQANGIKWGQYDVVVIGNSAQRFAALKSGSVDATMLVPPTAFTAEKDGFKNLAMIKDYAGDLPMASADVMVPWAKAHEDVAKHLVAALDQAAAYFYDDSKRASTIQILVDVSKADPAQVAQSYDLARKIDMYAKESSVSRTDLQHLIDGMKSVGDLEGVTIDADQLVIPGLTKMVD